MNSEISNDSKVKTEDDSSFSSIWKKVDLSVALKFEEELETKPKVYSKSVSKADLLRKVRDIETNVTN